ncbi:Fic family protein [Marinoscillum furvescens]|nr:DUF4172 domain-containing protein [Marinoscillum furvescens]
MPYNWQLHDWPHFRFDDSVIEHEVIEMVHLVGKTHGMYEGLTDQFRDETLINALVEEAVKTSEIEGEYVSRKDVLSSVRHNLGFENSHHSDDHRARGAADLVMLSRSDWNKPLSEQMLHAWHNALLQGNKDIALGRWRTHSEPMQVISGALGQERVHFEAPPSREVPGEMSRLIDWYNGKPSHGVSPMKYAPIKSALVHIYFESIHPYEDGNGRIGRALSQKALSEGFGYPVMVGLSPAIEAKKKEYDAALMEAQSTLDVTSWLQYFLGVLKEGILTTDAMVRFTLKKASFFDTYGESLNERQLKVIRRVFQEGHSGFEGGLSARKYMAIAKCPKATATRDLQYLHQQGILRVVGAGRSTRYELIY